MAEGVLQLYERDDKEGFKKKPPCVIKNHTGKICNLALAPSEGLNLQMLQKHLATTLFFVELRLLCVLNNSSTLGNMRGSDIFNFFSLDLTDCLICTTDTNQAFTLQLGSAADMQDARFDILAHPFHHSIITGEKYNPKFALSLSLSSLETES